MGINIITISREFGSGGRTIGKALADKLGVPCYDSEIMEKVAEKSGFAKDYIADKGEYAPSGPFSGIFRNNYYYQASNEDIIWSVQSKIISELAEKPCVIVGRCADFILRDRDDVLKTFIYADKNFRAKRIVEIYGENDFAPEKRLKDKDKQRAAYYQYYTDMKWGDARHYDISLNSAYLGIDRCVDILFDLCKDK